MVDNNEYPYNLIYEIVGEDIEYPADIEGSLEYVLAATLTERERRCISMYYRDGASYGKIADKEHVTRERIRQVTAKALRKLRNPSRAKYLEKGIAAMLTEKREFCFKEEVEELKKLIKAAAPQVAEKIMDREQQEKDNIPIIRLELSVRTYNCLYRKGISTLGELAKLSYMELVHIRNLGKRSLDEINDKLRECGYPPKVEPEPLFSGMCGKDDKCTT